ncbi:MAG: flagellar biosynthesis protein FlhB [Acetobacteraceae bacterium]|nr:flagellar biosynthesis protein FlhB [Acetobacteraceae bacterium]
MTAGEWALDLQLFAEEKQEEPTWRRRQEARRKGQVFRSLEVTSVGILVAGFLAVRWLGPGICRELTGFLRHCLSLPGVAVGPGGASRLAVDAVGVFVRAALPVLGLAFLAGTVANLGQVGVVFTPHLLAPDLGRINPAVGLARMFSRRAVMDLLKAGVKVAAVGGVTYFTLAGVGRELPALCQLDVGEAAGRVAGMAWTVFWRASLALFALAMFDYLYQRWEHELKLRMSREELKEELKETEGHPQIKGRIRRAQHQLARRRMLSEVKRADVVVTNPVEFAVALRYDMERMAAPVVVAKGRGLLAERIRAIALEAGVTVVPNPPLAQALFWAVEVGRAIPVELYQAVAEVLAYVYRLKRRVGAAGSPAAGSARRG